jgi:hypothetical protein
MHDTVSFVDGLWMFGAMVAAYFLVVYPIIRSPAEDPPVPPSHDPEPAEDQKLEAERALLEAYREWQAANEALANRPPVKLASK